MESCRVRKPVVAGQFYPKTSEALTKEIESVLDKGAVPADCIACMLPHAGYMYSGRIAGKTVSRIKVRETVVLLGPNHTGNGPAFSIMEEGVWETPLGSLAIDNTLARALRKGSRYLMGDELAHRYEHSLEVELPFLQYFRRDFGIVPIAFLSDDTDALKEIGIGIGEILARSGLLDKTLLVASSDMTHYESLEDAERKDRQAIEAILALDEDGLARQIARLRISMCGYAPVIVMLAAAKQLGAKSAKLVGYETSAEVTGDRDSVVGYAGIIIS